jgi:hypothetical protein
MVPGRLKSTQCTQVPTGASGSSQISAYAFVPSGTSVHSRGGETSMPSQVYLLGMNAPSSKAELLIFMITPPTISFIML